MSVAGLVKLLQPGSKEVMVRGLLLKRTISFILPGGHRFYSQTLNKMNASFFRDELKPSLGTTERRTKKEVITYDINTIPRQKHMDKLSHSNRKFSVTWNLVEPRILFQKLSHFPELLILQGDAPVYTQSIACFMNWQRIYPAGNTHSFKREAFHGRPDTDSITTRMHYFLLRNRRFR